MLVGSVAMTLVASQKEDLFLVARLQLAQPDIAELDLHGRALVQLQGDQARLKAVLRIFIKFRDHHAVDQLDALIAAGDDVILVPAIHVNVGQQLLAVPELGQDLWFGLFGTDQRLLAPLGQDTLMPLAVGDAHVFRAFGNVCLIATDHPGFPLDAEAAILDATVMIAQFELGFEFKISDLVAFPDEEGVGRNRGFQRGFPHNYAVFDPPETGVTVPAVKRLAVENLSESGICL